MNRSGKLILSLINNSRRVIIKRPFSCYNPNKSIFFTVNRNNSSAKTTRKMSSNNTNATFEDMLKFVKDESRLIIDVREPNELKETGVIPGSINIPLGELESALVNLSDEDFEKKYGVKKPSKDCPVVFSCKLGGRAGKARVAAENAGYTDALSYGGSWTEWAEKYKA